MSFKRSRVSRSDSFDHPNYPSSSSTQNPNKFFKPSFAVSSPVKASVGVGMKLCQQSLGNFLKECFFCKSSIQSDKSIFMYRSLAFCKEECRAIQMHFDEELVKQSKLSNKKVQH
ncbi:uncharacterized protein LOC142163549 [Nicotiana tabacum]|uniref:Uncharacterized protein LOC142163549 n=1 Tax=Nicotiana tabacum TaxID=4097 RepID=A0AC58RW54_TOBAC